MHRFNRQPHATLLSQRQQLIERLSKQSPGMICGMHAARATMNDQASGPEGLRRTYGSPGVAQALLVGMTVAARKAAGPLQAGNGQAGPGYQLGSSLLPDVGQLLPPYANRGAEGRILGDILFKRPA
jgi:hypothetical protein